MAPAHASFSRGPNLHCTSPMCLSARHGGRCRTHSMRLEPTGDVEAANVGVARILARHAELGRLRDHPGEAQHRRAAVRDLGKLVLLLRFGVVRLAEAPADAVVARLAI